MARFSDLRTTFGELRDAWQAHWRACGNASSGFKVLSKVIQALTTFGCGQGRTHMLQSRMTTR